MDEYMPTPKELSRAALGWIKEDPESWDQQYFHDVRPENCGTTHCYAGHIDIILQELTPDYRFYPEIEKADNLFHPVRERLGLNDSQWNWITYHNNSFDKLVEIHNQLFDDDLTLTLDKPQA